MITVISLFLVQKLQPNLFNMHFKKVVTDREIEVCIGVSYFMGLKKLPALRDYWGNDELGVPFVRDSMSRDRFEEIRKNFHFSNNWALNMMTTKLGRFSCS